MHGNVIGGTCASVGPHPNPTTTIAVITNALTE
jgi:hypothetical protein